MNERCWTNKRAKRKNFNVKTGKKKYKSSSEMFFLFLDTLMDQGFAKEYDDKAKVWEYENMS